MAAECANYAMDHICAQAKEHLGEFDGVFFAVHGAGIAENTPDLEAWSFIAAGCDMSTYRIVGLKSMNHFKGYFRDTADAIVCADPPGQCPMDIRLHDYKNVRRPIIPLDGDVEY